MNKIKSTVLALKYRPSNFKDLIGQEYLVETIIKAIKLDKIPNAYIFTGIRGVGKTTAARIVAKMLNCTAYDKDKNLLLDDCEQAKAITEDRHPDVLEIDAASNTSVDNAREIIENVKYSPVLGKFKIYIIDEVHMLSKSAFNALLKTLEEPPEHAKFIFATTEISKVPITILSRCQRFDLRRVDKITMLAFLKKIIIFEKIKISEEALLMIVRAGDGSVRDSISILDQANIFKTKEEISISDIVNMLGSAKITDIYQICIDIINNNTNNLISILENMYKCGTETNKVLEELMSVINWSMKIRIKPKMLEDNFLKDEDKAFALEVNKVDIGHLNIFWQSLMKGYEEIKISPNPNITLEMILLRTCFLINDNFEDTSNEKKKSEKQKKVDNPQNNGELSKKDTNINKKTDNDFDLKKKINLYETFYDFYGTTYSPLMASLILENCEILNFNIEKKELNIASSIIDFPGREEIQKNLNSSFALNIEKREKITLLGDLKKMYKQEVINQEIKSDEFKKVLAKFPNAKILDIEDIERGNIK